MESLATAALIFERARPCDAENVRRDPRRTNKRFSAVEAGSVSSSSSAMQAAAHRVSMSGAAGRQIRVLVTSQASIPGTGLHKDAACGKNTISRRAAAMTTKPDEGDVSADGHSNGQQTMARWKRADRRRPSEGCLLTGRDSTISSRKPVPRLRDQRPPTNRGSFVHLTSEQFSDCHVHQMVSSSRTFGLRSKRC